MNEIHHIHLGRQAYTIAVDAYKELHEYLEAIKRQVGDDVASEVELRMSELLAERGIAGKKVILKQDIRYLKVQLGTPGDFSDEDSVGEKAGKLLSANTPEAGTTKRLFRNTDEAMLAGVCAGLAEYFGIDALIVRLIFIVLVFFGGGGVLLYIVLWLLVPEAKTNSERLQMQGKPVTVNAIKQVVSRADVQGATRRASQTVKPMAKKAVRLLTSIIGVGLIVGAILALLAVLTVGIYVWTNRGQVIGGQSIFPVGVKQELLLLGGVMALFILNTFVLLGGIAMFKRRAIVPAWVSAALGTLLLVSIAASVALGMDTGHQIRMQFQAIHHSYTVSEKPFTKLDLHGGTAWYSFVPDSTYKVEYRYNGKPAGKLNASVKDGTLSIDVAGLSSDPCDFVCLYNDRNLHVVVHAPSVESVAVAGDNASFNINAPLKQQNLTVSYGEGVTVLLSYMNPENVLMAGDVVKNTQTFEMLGLRQAYAQDTIWGNNGFVSLSRAGTVEVKTQAGCTPPQPGNSQLINLLSFPDKLIINGRAFASLGDLQAAQRADQPNAQSPTNCLTVGVDTFQPNIDPVIYD